MASQESVDNFNNVIRCGVFYSKALYSVNPKFPREIDDLATLAEKELSTADGDFKINFHPRIYQAKKILGKMEHYGGSAHIVYDRAQNVCWRRFIVAKEICQLLYNKYMADSDSHMTGTPEEVSQLLTEIMAGAPASSSDAAACDNYAKLMALEVLLPHHERTQVEKELAAGKPALEIAKFYRVPQMWLDFYGLPKYKSLMDECYAK